MSALHRRVSSGRIILRALSIFLPIAASIGIVICLLYYWDRRHERSLRTLEAIQSVHLQVEIIRRELDSIKSDLLYLADQQLVHSLLTESAPEQRAALEREYLSFSMRKGLYDQVRCLDDAGREVARINFNGGNPAIVPISDLQDKSDRYYFKEAVRLGKEEVYVSPFDLNIEHEELEIPFKPTIRMATPVYSAAGEALGVVVLNYLGQKLVDKLDEAAAAVAGSGMLLNQEGHWLNGPSQEYEWGFALGHNRTFANDFPMAWARMTEHDEGQFVTKDGLFTFQWIVYSPRYELNGIIPEGQTLVNQIAMIVVSYKPNDVLYRRPNAQLPKLLLVYVIVLLFLFALILLLARAQAVRAEYRQEIVQSEARLRALSSELFSAQEDERRRISRNLHDDLGHQVTAVCLYLERALQLGPGEQSEASYRRALDASRGILESIREFSLKLRPRILDDLGLRDAVQSHASEFESRTGIDTVTELDFNEKPVPHPVSENIFRILQEALNNASQYAKADRIDVQLSMDDQGIHLIVRDNGEGFDVAAVGDRSLGILGMRERAELLGGSFSITSAKGIGTTVRAFIPFSEKVNRGD